MGFILIKMAKFVIKAFDIRSFEEEIEADSEDDAKDIFLDKYDVEDLESAESNLFFENDEGFEAVRDLVENSGEDTENFED